MKRPVCCYARFLAIAVCAAWLGVATPAVRAQGGNDAKILADAHHQLNGKRFSGVHVQVENGVVVLTGEVDRYADKADAEKRIDKMHEAASVRNEIKVAGAGNVSDHELFEKLAKKLTYVREGYPSFPFNSISLQVHDGVVTISGLVVNPVDKEDVMGIVNNEPGVRDVIDHLKVAPVSPMDNRIRFAEYRAIYGSPQFTRYAINPAKPIRIVVENGHVTLTGVVDSTGDRDVAGLRANGVPGVFSVKNDLQVAGQNEH